jgi:hypothetical protein
MLLPGRDTLPVWDFLMIKIPRIIKSECGSGIRTRNGATQPDPKSGAFANSAIPACFGNLRWNLVLVELFPVTQVIVFNSKIWRGLRMLICVRLRFVEFDQPKRVGCWTREYLSLSHVR